MSEFLILILDTIVSLLSDKLFGTVLRRIGRVFYPYSESRKQSEFGCFLLLSFAMLGFVLLTLVIPHR